VTAYHQVPSSLPVPSHCFPFHSTNTPSQHHVTRPPHYPLQNPLRIRHYRRPRRLRCPNGYKPKGTPPTPIPPPYSHAHSCSRIPSLFPLLPSSSLVHLPIPNSSIAPLPFTPSNLPPPFLILPPLPFPFHTDHHHQDSTPYILTCIASRVYNTSESRSEGYTVAVQSTFASREDVEFYDNECPAHKELKKLTSRVHKGVCTLLMD
jgi:hypothetical protein